MFINPKKPNITLKCGFSLCFVTRYILAIILSSINILAYILAPIHIARHTFAVLAINDGLTMTVVSRLLGHSSTDITEKVYARLLPQTLTAQVEKLNYTFMPEELH